MAEEPRRSGRATKGQHKNASASPAPQPKPAKQTAQPKTKPAAKAQDNEQEEEQDYDDEEEKIRCICGDDNPKDKRAFIGCDSCEVWQHNVCMGMPEDEDEVPDHYFCEQCQPEDHGETLAAMARDEKIWETRNKIYQNEKKAGAKRKGKSGKTGGGWLKKEVTFEPSESVEVDGQATADSDTAVGSKRKRGEEVESMEMQADEVKAEPEEVKTTRGSRQDKRRKAAADGDAVAGETGSTIVPIDKLPTDRQRIAAALSKILFDDFSARAQEGTLDASDGQTAKSLADHHARHVEHALSVSHEGPNNPAYLAQYRALNANLKKNKVLISRLLDGSLSAEELSTMNSKDMASEELQKERAVMKEQLDRQAVAVQVEEGRPRFRRTHKGDELIEDENAMVVEGVREQKAQPVRERSSVQDGAGSPTAEQASPVEPLKIDTARSQSQTGLEQRRTSSQQFDMNNIWAKTAQSPTSSTTPGGAPLRPMQQAPKRRSSVKNQQQQEAGVSGTKEDADVDRMLQDDDEDETYSPAEYADPDGVVWRGKLIQSADAVSPTVNARFVAGRDLTSTVSWRDLLPPSLSIDGRLQVSKAEEYLCSLQWSQSSDVSVLALTPYDDAEGFEAVFQYFKSRARYAVVNKDKPPMVKDLYVIPVDAGQEVPSHVGMLEFNRLGGSVSEKCLLASLVVARASGNPSALGGDGTSDANTVPAAAASSAGGGANGQHHTLPQHMRSATAAGPAGSPLNTAGATFSPPSSSTGLPPNPYGPPQQQQPPAPAFAGFANPLVNEVLGNLQYAPTAQQVIGADPAIARDKLEHLKTILEEDPRARTEMDVLWQRLTN